MDILGTVKLTCTCGELWEMEIPRHVVEDLQKQDLLDLEERK